MSTHRKYQLVLTDNHISLLNRHPIIQKLILGSSNRLS
jgi:hypothetical protein